MTLCRLCILLAAVACAGVSAASPAAAADLISVTSYQLVAARTLPDGRVEETYRPVFTHSGVPGDADAVAVRAIAWSRTPGLQLLDAFVQVGSIAAGSSVVSPDLLTLRRASHVRFEPAHLGWSVRWLADRLVDPAWLGAWVITARAHDADSGALLSTVTADLLLAPGDSLGLSRLPHGVACRASTSSDGGTVHCRTDVSNGTCRLKASLDLSLVVTPDDMSGGGAWLARGNATCPQGTAAFGQRIEVTAVRSTGAASAGVLDAVLPAILDLPMPLRDVHAETAVPASAADCAGGAYRGFVFPAFATEGQCVEFVTRQSGGVR